jgi:hypothetical protein
MKRQLEREGKQPDADKKIRPACSTILDKPGKNSYLSVRIPSSLAPKSSAEEKEPPFLLLLSVKFAVVSQEDARKMTTRERACLMDEETYDIIHDIARSPAVIEFVPHAEEPTEQVLPAPTVPIFLASSMQTEAVPKIVLEPSKPVLSLPSSPLPVMSLLSSSSSSSSSSSRPKTFVEFSVPDAASNPEPVQKDALTQSSTITTASFSSAFSSDFEEADDVYDASHFRASFNFKEDPTVTEIESDDEEVDEIPEIECDDEEADEIPESATDSSAMTPFTQHDEIVGAATHSIASKARGQSPAKPEQQKPRPNKWSCNNCVRVHGECSWGDCIRLPESACPSAFQELDTKEGVRHWACTRCVKSRDKKCIPSPFVYNKFAKWDNFNGIKLLPPQNVRATSKSSQKKHDDEKASKPSKKKVASKRQRDRIANSQDSDDDDIMPTSKRRALTNAPHYKGSSTMPSLSETTSADLNSTGKESAVIFKIPKPVPKPIPKIGDQKAVSLTKETVSGDNLESLAHGQQAE